MDDIIAAHTLIRLLDLTALNPDDTEYTIEDLCLKARSPYGSVAAVCVWPKFVTLAKRLLINGDIKVATVVNFPKGENNLNNLKKEIYQALEAGANEIDAVFPYTEFLKKNYKAYETFVSSARDLCEGKTLKVILETGEFPNALKIIDAAKICINGGADFIKTSTGKTKVSATPEAANAILETIADSKRNVGFKASGGIRTIEEAKKYLVLATEIMGYKWVTPANMRIGASSLLTNLINTIQRGY